jgi:hypothetical protein
VRYNLTKGYKPNGGRRVFATVGCSTAQTGVQPCYHVTRDDWHVLPAKQGFLQGKGPGLRRCTVIAAIKAFGSGKRRAVALDVIFDGTRRMASKLSHGIRRRRIEI